MRSKMLKFLLLSPILILGATSAYAHQQPWDDGSAELVTLTQNNIHKADVNEAGQYALNADIPGYGTSICYDVKASTPEGVAWQCYEVLSWGGSAYDKLISMQKMQRYLQIGNWSAKRLRGYTRNSTPWQWDDYYPTLMGDDNPEGPALAPAPIFDVRLIHEADGEQRVVVISLNEEAIQVENAEIVLNRGNCGYTETDILSNYVSYGEDFSALNTCKYLKEVTIDIPGYEPATYVF